MKITMLGTGHAMVNNCFNTCFIMEDNSKPFLVDTGGGYQILPLIAKAGYKLTDIHDVFITHKHTDHITGISWILRSFISHSRKDPESLLRVYGNDDVINLVSTMARLQFGDNAMNLIDKNLFFITVEDRQEVSIIDNTVTFFDAYAKKVPQFGFVMKDHEGSKYVCCGDEPLAAENYSLAENCRLLMHEAFCMEKDAGIFNPHRISHSTVKDVCLKGSEIHAENVLIYHTEDHHMDTRKKEYTAEGREYFSGGVLVPDDLEQITL